MREEIAKLVHPVIQQALTLRERVLSNPDEIDLANEQAAIKGMLQSELEARRHVDFGGDGGRPSSSNESMLGVSQSMSMGSRRSDPFLGIRYALACWLDEIFIDTPAWSSLWNERKIEEALYGTNDRAFMFWEQARKAEARPGGDALEVYFLCVMLGFRGDYRYEPEKLQAWVAATQTRIAKSQGGEWPVPPELDAPVNVPPLHGRERLQRMIVIGGVLFLILIPVLTFSLFKYFG